MPATPWRPPVRRALLSLATVGLMSLGLVSLGRSTAHAAPAPGEVGGAPLTVPFAALTDDAVTPEALKGKVVLLDIWATWCEPCRHALPAYDALQRKYGPQGLVVVAVSVDEDRAKARAFFEGAGFALKGAWDPKGTWPQRLGLSTMPTTWLIDRTGAVVKVHAGYRAGDEAGLEAALKALLAPPAP